jgi:hypothetical protein
VHILFRNKHSHWRKILWSRQGDEFDPNFMNFSDSIRGNCYEEIEPFSNIDWRKFCEGERFNLGNFAKTKISVNHSRNDITLDFTIHQVDTKDSGSLITEEKNL